jgi:hypothetical protein
MAPASVLRRSTLYNDRKYPWSLDSRNAERVHTQFLGPVKDGIILAVKKLRTTIEPAYLEWLHKHNVDFQIFATHRLPTSKSLGKERVWAQDH